MANYPTGAYHLADNPKIFEVQRNNNFEFVVTNINDILMAGASPDDASARISNAEEILTLSVSDAPVPHFSQEPIEIKRGNSTIKYAGVPKFDAGELKFHDFLGARTKEILMAWQNLSYNVEDETVGCLMHRNYKKDCYLIEYAPDYHKVRTWKLFGCWISGISEDPYSSDNSGEKKITVNIQYDRAKIDD